MRYEDGNCTIAISMIRCFNDVLEMVFNVGHIFVKNRTRPKAIIIHGFRVKIQPTTKWTSLKCSIHADHNGANPASYLIPSPSYLAKNI